ncbi:dTDP-4-dehydrorhamnose 3,5-epimerase [Brevundimonas sp. NPDC058933]|uniref:dTDP-4-dehydrorhamnose 3,5-epimerase n=1 Tax=Brevundimonas sp. NPDC058933 TaxID=3346673 RepID=UPI003BEEBB3D
MTESPVFLLTPRRFEDARGWFSETYSQASMAKFGVNETFVQDNQSFSRQTGTVRGIHFQRSPHAQAKLVRCVRGSLIDYAVDLRRQSPTFGRWVSVRLSADGGEQLYIPVGFGHAFATLEPDVEIAYKVTDVYAPDCDGGVRWNDPKLAIEWPLPASGAVLSDKDAVLPTLDELDVDFAYDGRPLLPLAV